MILDKVHKMSSCKPGQFEELRAWMAKGRISFRDLSRRAGVGKNVLHRLVAGDFVRADERLCQKISAATDGAVGHEAWMAFLARRFVPREKP